MSDQESLSPHRFAGKIPEHSNNTENEEDDTKLLLHENLPQKIWNDDTELRKNEEREEDGACDNVAQLGRVISH